MRRELARALGLLLGYAAMCVGLRLVDAIVPDELQEAAA